MMDLAHVRVVNLLSLYKAHADHGFGRSRSLLLMLMSLVPGSFLWMDRRIVAWTREQAGGP
jgi:hypothetical protein